MYVLMEKEGTWKFPDFSDKCPLCSSTDCAYHYTSYTRNAINVDGQILTVVIARYLCRSKGFRKKGTDQTFSLLPSNLMPYRSTHLQLVQMLLYYWIVLHKSIGKVLDFAALDIPVGFYPSQSFFYSCKKVFLMSLMKLDLSIFFQEKFYSDKNKTELYYFLKQINVYKYKPNGSDSAIEGITGISLDYYHREGNWDENSYFLFGTAYQHRGRFKQ